jgi:DNA mismatch repair protein MutS2
MPIAEHTLETLEFPKIREQLAHHTSFSASRALALELTPSTNMDDISYRLQLTREAGLFFDTYPNASIGGVHDIRSVVVHAERGGVIETSDFLNILSTLRSMRTLRATLHKLEPADFPILTEQSLDLPELPTIEQAIERTVGDDGNVLDTASATLGRLRHDIRIASNRLQERLQSMVSGSKYADALQDAIVTVRNGRYVIPVKAAHRRSVPGLVHDQSASGATLYIEPMAIVELNNHLRQLQLDEQQEVHRILSELSHMVGHQAPAIATGVDRLATLDLGFAQARYAYALRCIEPDLVVVEHGEQGMRVDRGHASPAFQNTSQDASLDMHHPEAPLYIQQARHPLLEQETVVPIDIWLGENFQILMITGPNTGGKTVALKTVGLLALMAQAGLHIPARAPSRLPIFTQVFADIGDEQSIEQSLSTFSSHMRTIIRMLNAIDEERGTRNEERGTRNEERGTRSEERGTRNEERGTRSEERGTRSEERGTRNVEAPVLVLLDEIGAGTDPTEGAALARAIIERLLEQGCMGIITTHYAELKAFAHNTVGVQNGSVEFDSDTLAPTYRLTIGLPGRSNALAIAERLGMPPALVERARNTTSTESLHVERLLEDIHHKSEAATAAWQQAERMRTDAEKYRERLARELQAFEDTRHEHMQDAVREVDEEFRDIRHELRRLRELLRNETHSHQAIQETEQHLQHIQSQVKDITKRAKKRSTPSSSPSPSSSVTDTDTSAEDVLRPLRVGDRVLVRSIGLSGEIVAIDEDEAEADIQVGNFRVHSNLNELRLEERARAKPGHNTSRESYEATRAVSLPPAPEVSITLDMRGWRTADVTEGLERHLNNAYLSGLPHVRLIHGKGSGALRQMVQEILRTHSLVHSFSSGGTDGGDGVTVAKLVAR